MILTINVQGKIAAGKAIPGRIYHGDDIPEDYCRVEVSTVVQGYEDEVLDIPGPEGIEKLGQAIKNFILWPRRDVQLSEPPQTQPDTQSSPLHSFADPQSSPPHSFPDPLSPSHSLPDPPPSPSHQSLRDPSPSTPSPFKSTPSP